MHTCLKAGRYRSLIYVPWCKYLTEGSEAHSSIVCGTDHSRLPCSRNPTQHFTEAALLWGRHTQGLAEINMHQKQKCRRTE